ncbi:MAG: Rrf2 family transcriptional regulator [Planctomycetota bacterium]|nr:Rrf2 family transcriptional regulator [Planctomycetota bacterium]
MKVSRKSEYALRAMLELAIQAREDQVVRTADIARSQHISEKFLELILVELRHAGLVTSRRGPVGGHRLARDPPDISVGDIWRAVDDPVTKTVSGKGSRASSDPFRGIWEDVDKAVAGVVDRVSLEDVKRMAETNRGAPDFSI